MPSPRAVIPRIRAVAPGLCGQPDAEPLRDGGIVLIALDRAPPTWACSFDDKAVRRRPARWPCRSKNGGAQEHQDEDTRDDTVDPEGDEAVLGDVAQEPADA